MLLFWYHLKEQFMAGHNRWSLWLPVGFATGIGLYFVLPVEPSKWLTLGIIEILIALAILLRRRLEYLYLLLIPASLAAGFMTIQLRTVYLASHQYPVPENKLYLQGKIVKTDYNSRGHQRITLDNLKNFDGLDVPGKFRVSLRPQPEILQSGQCVELIAKLMKRPQAALPQGYQFDRKSFYLGLSGSGYSESRVIRIPCPSAPSWSERVNFGIDHLRGRLINHIKSVLPPDESSIAAAVIAGEQGGIKQQLIQNYRDSGLAHFLSISGLHMSMIAGLMFFFIRLIIALVPPLALRHDSKKIAGLFSILISVVYLMISGAAVPAQRAFIMTFIVLLGILFNRRAVSIQTISWAAFIVLLISPEALIGASFQMSFAAVVALIAFYERFAKPLHRFLNGPEDKLSPLWLKVIKIIFVYFIGILVSDLVASLATLPFAIYHFNRIALYTTLANLLAGPVIGLLIMPFILLSLILIPLGLDFWTLKIVGFGISQVNAVTSYVSSLHGAAYLVPSMPLWGLLLIVYGGLWLAIWQTSWRKFGLILILVGFLSMLTVRQPDVLINDNGNLVALKDNYNNLVIIPSRGERFTKQVWLDKTASTPLSSEQAILMRNIYKGKTTSPDWIDLKCSRGKCVYKNIFRFDTKGNFTLGNQKLYLRSSGGAAIYFLKNRFKITTVRDYTGQRLWNE